MIALTDGTNKINLAILIREYLKVCFEQEIVSEETAYVFGQWQWALEKL